MQRGALRTFQLWSVIFAVLLAALAPAISQAMQSGSGAAGQVFVCTPTGSRWIDADAATAPDSKKSPPGGDHAFEHCPYCSFHAAGLGMPPSGLALPPLPASYALHWRYSAATPTLDFWSDALSRGPPARA